jgi:exosome complex RNA-binding protein Rrp42 (RNase PH superfamily)
VIDGAFSEYLSASAACVIAVNEDGSCCGTFKLLGGSFSIESLSKSIQVSPQIVCVAFH